MIYPIFILLPVLMHARDPVVKLDEYTAHGFHYKYKQNGMEYVSNAYLGLPYAQAPVGDLRLEKPRRLEPENGKVVKNNELKPGCLPQEDIGAVVPISEDCLYLNVITPSTPPTEGTKYPVLVWIHGGAFVYGSTRTDGWKQFARHFNSQGVIVVLLQYRLAFWGFFALGIGNGEAGNFGLWDQTAALQFVYENISSFGGDPKKVTLFGDSSGSASIHALSLSPFSRELFQQTIQSSGSLYNPWSHSLKTIQSSEKIVRELGCFFEGNIKESKECLKKVDKSVIWNVLQSWGRSRKSMDMLLWGPIMDQEFFAGKTIEQLTKDSPIRKTLYGFTKGDGLAFTFRKESSPASHFAKTLAEQDKFSKNDLEEHVRSVLGSDDVAGRNADEILKLLLQYYLRDGPVPHSATKLWYTRYTDAQTDGSFAAGQLMEIMNKKHLNWKQYVFLFDYVRPSHHNLLGIDPTYTPHGYQYQYLMDTKSAFPFKKNEINDVELKFTTKIVNAFVHFIKTGNPSSKEVIWPTVDHLQDKITYLRVGEQVVAESTHFTEMAKTWKTIYHLGYGQNIS